MQDKENDQEFRNEQEEIEMNAKVMGARESRSYVEYARVIEGRHVGRAERDDRVEDRIEFDVSHYHHDRADEELEEFFVLWDDISSEHVVALKQTLRREDSGRGEGVTGAMSGLEFGYSRKRARYAGISYAEQGVFAPTFGRRPWTIRFTKAKVGCRSH